MTVKECAKLLGKSEQFVRIGLQRGIFNFGHAVKMSSKWTYHISAKKVAEYVGEKEGGLNETISTSGERFKRAGELK